MIIFPLVRREDNCIVPRPPPLENEENNFFALRGYTPDVVHIKKNGEYPLIKKLKTSYNSALRNLLLSKKPYSASTMFVAHDIPSFYELLRTSIYRFADRVSKNSKSIIMACMTRIVYIHSPIRQWWRSVLC